MSPLTSKYTSLKFKRNQSVFQVSSYEHFGAVQLKLSWFFFNRRSVATVFGVETVIAGVLGVVSGSFVALKLRKRFPRADPLVSGVGLLLSAPFMTAALLLASGPAVVTFVVMFFGQLFLNLNWALVADMCLVNIDSPNGLVLLASTWQCPQCFQTSAPCQFRVRLFTLFVLCF